MGTCGWPNGAPHKIMNLLFLTQKFDTGGPKAIRQADQVRFALECSELALTSHQLAFGSTRGPVSMRRYDGSQRN